MLNLRLTTFESSERFAMPRRSAFRIQFPSTGAEVASSMTYSALMAEQHLRGLEHVLAQHGCDAHLVVDRRPT
jgi:hypothetical protein